MVVLYNRSERKQAKKKGAHLWRNQMTGKPGTEILLSAVNSLKRRSKKQARVKVGFAQPMDLLLEDKYLEG
jgi:hypothetical protein